MFDGLPGVGSASGLARSGKSAGGDEKSNADVKSPLVFRRQSLMFGSRTPNSRSMKRIVELWSNVSPQANPPVLHGETTIIGTRKPGPIGPATPPAAGGTGLTYSPGVPGGAVCGRT